MIAALFGKRRPAPHLRVDGSDREFDTIYPHSIRRYAGQHFTPLAVAKRAASFLVDCADKKVLDIGSGAGKFCLIGAVTTTGHFTGVEQRHALVKLSTRIAASCSLKNTTFIHSNILAVDFSAFDAFYMFNPFFENVSAAPLLDRAVLSSPALFKSYSSYVSGQLQSLREGTRLATYYTSPSMIPASFSEVEVSEDGHLRLWVKKR